MSNAPLKASEKFALWTVLSVAIFVVYLFVTGGEDQAHEVKPSTPSDFQIKSAGQKWLKDKLKDPDSVEFRNVFVSTANAVCGEFNAKNSFGGYAGFQRFISAGPDATFLEDQVEAGGFDVVWPQYCARKQ